MSYETAKFIHILGVIILVGNVTATALWKFLADRTGDPQIVAFAQRLITLTDWSLTLWGVILMMVGGYSAAAIGGLDLAADKWLLVGQLLFLLSGLLWLCVLIPLQIKLARAARRFTPGDPVPEAYARASRIWFILGIAATVPLIAAAWVMVAKPL